MVAKAAPSEQPNQEAHIRALEAAFRKDNVKNANNLIDLINFITPTNHASVKAIHAGRRVIVALQNTPADNQTLQTWLQHRREQYAQALISIIQHSTNDDAADAAVAAAVLTHPYVCRTVLHFILSSASERIRVLLLHSFIARFVDVRFVALQLVAERVASVQIRLHVLSQCVQPTTEHAHAPVSAKVVTKAYTSAWLSVMQDSKLELSERLQILTRLPKELIPNMLDPLRLADFLISSYDTPDINIAISSLDGLFILIADHKLDYPLFYPKLYALLTDQALFYAPNRTRFLELTASFLLRGSMLPGGMVAAFVKRLVRRALLAPTAGALWCLRLALDLLYKHPNISYLVHQSVNLFEDSHSVGVKRPRSTEMNDPFDDDEVDPQASKADQSSLWELHVLSNHVAPSVSRLVSAFRKDVRKHPAPPPGSLADYSELTFEDIFQAEMRRKVKSYHLAYHPPGAAPAVVKLRKHMGPYISWT